MNHEITRKVMSSVALAYVVNLLSRREYSEYELRCKMQEKAFDEETINAVIAHCQQKNWQNDKRFAENYLHFRSQRGYGINRIKQELEEIIGLKNVKEYIFSLEEHYKVQQMRAQKGLRADGTSMHMIFTGNPERLTCMSSVSAKKSKIPPGK